MINYIESVINSLLRDFLQQGPLTAICIGNVTGAAGGDHTHTAACQGQQGENTSRCNSKPNRSETSTAVAAISGMRRPLVYGHFGTRQRFAMIVYLLSETHGLLANQACCTYRELLYKNVYFAISPVQITRSIRDICGILNESAWNLGIFAIGKGLIAGPLRICMSSGDVIDCSSLTTPTMIPPNFTYIDYFETSAQFILVVEKDTVFKKLLLYDVFIALQGQILLVTARGFPDISTRWVLRRLVSEHQLMSYILVDGDPFGIEIMLVYRYGSRAFRQYAKDLACPTLQWLGIHPSEMIANTMVPREALTALDYRKIDLLLQRQQAVEELRRQIIVLKQYGFKTKLDNMPTESFVAFIYDYIVKKIAQQLAI